MESIDTRKRDVIIIALLLLIYIAVRIALVPANPWTSQGMAHDGAYLAMVAKNLLAGKGFVLDALWLVFLQPDHLPMPYHNANPLYPIAIALITRVTGWDVVRSGLVISAVSNAGIILAMTLIVVRFVGKPLVAAAIAFGVGLFPVVWDLSWSNVTDEFSLMLLLGAIAVLMWDEKPALAGAAGVLFGLSWLARSMVTITFPAICVWLLLRSGWRKGAVHILLFSAAAFVVSVPWLIHNQHTWGDPLRSDNAPLMSIAVYYRHAYGASARAWFSPEPPEPLGQLVREHPAEIAKNWLHDQAPFFKVLLTGITGASYLKLALLSLLTVGLAVRNKASFLNKEGAAFAVYLAAVFATMSVFGGMMEPRYFVQGYTVFAAWLLTNMAGLRWQIPDNQVLTRGCLVLAVLYVFIGMLAGDMKNAAFYRQADDEERVPLMQAATAVDQTISHGAPVVVGFHPYFYSMFSGAQALAIPQSDDAYLLHYMRKYHACCILLSEQELAFWRPQWRTGLPPHIYLIRSLDGYNVYGMTP